MCGLIRLDSHIALLFPSPCSSSHLCQQLKSDLISTEIGKKQQLVGIDYAHHTDIIKVQSFTHHLRSNEDLRPLSVKSLDDFPKCMFPFSGIPIQALDADAGKNIL